MVRYYFHYFDDLDYNESRKVDAALAAIQKEVKILSQRKEERYRKMGDTPFNEIFITIDFDMDKDDKASTEHINKCVSGLDYLNFRHSTDLTHFFFNMFDMY